MKNVRNAWLRLTLICWGAAITPLIVFGQGLPTYVPTSGLVGWWGFNGNAQDASGGGNHGTLFQVTPTTDRFGVQGRAYDFNGTQSRIDINTTAGNFSADFTLSIWFYPRQNNGMILLSKRLDNGCGGSWWVQDVVGTEICNGSAAYRQLLHGMSWIPETWNHLLVRKQGNLFQQYINGSLVYSNSFPNTYTFSNNATLKVGTYFMPSVNQHVGYFNGRMDDIGIWNRALSQQEIAQVYAAQSAVIPQVPSCVNDTAEVTVSHPTLTGVAGAALRINYNPDSLVYVGYSNPGAAFASLNVAAGNGTVALDWNAAGNQNIAAGSLVTLRFRVLGSAVLSWDTLAIPSEFYDDQFNVLPVGFVNGRIANNSQRVVWNRVICEGHSFALGGQTYGTSGVYQGILPGSGSACDTAVQLNLTVIPRQTLLPPVTRCSNQPYSFNGQMLTVGGTYYDTLINSRGCDSVLQLVLTVHPAFVQAQSMVICPGSSFMFGGSSLTQSGTYTHTFTTAAGCDSTVNLTLVVPGNLQIAAAGGVNGFCPGGGVRIGSSTPLAGVLFQWLMDGNPVSGATLDTFRAVQPGSYQLQFVVAPACTLVSNTLVIEVLNCNRLRGDVRYDNAAQSPLAGVPVMLKTLLGNVVMRDTTDSAGVYELVGYANGSYIADVDINYPWGGVNSTDALWVSRYFTSVLGLTPLRVRAGDVNGNNITNSSDALNISRRITNVILTFPAGEFVSLRPSVNAAGNPVDLNLRVLSTGDVNGSYSAPPSPPVLVLDTVYPTSPPAATAAVRFTTAGAGVYEHGLCWSSSTNPTVLNNRSVAGSGGFAFTHTFAGSFTVGTTYYVRAYARNQTGVYYSNERSFVFVTTPVVTTAAITGVTSNAALGGGNVTSGGGLVVTARGVVYGTSPNPTIQGASTSNGTGTGAFTSQLTGLTASTNYYVRAYATNSVGTAYGNEVGFATQLPCGGSYTITDVDGNSYATVQIGTQCWTQSNLRVSKYRNGDNITNITDGTQWSQTNTNSTGAWCNYTNNASNGTTYGKLYNWYAVNDSRGLCPTGWHVPTDSEWNVMVKYLDPNADTAAVGWQGTNAGTALKSTTGWNNNGNGTNSSGFTGLPGGIRNDIGGFVNVGDFGYWWSSSDAGSGNAWYRLLGFNHAAVYRVSSDRRKGLSVRCARD